MGSSNLASAFLLFLTTLTLTLTLTKLADAQNSPQDFLDAHNSVRAAVGVGYVTWDTTLESYAQIYANKRIADCLLVTSGGPYGENIFMGTGLAYDASDAVHLWASEKLYYDHNTNTCAIGKVCFHYTQVVWVSSIYIGCARVTCNSGAIYIICSYNPPGNINGQSPY